MLKYRRRCTQMSIRCRTSWQKQWNMMIGWQKNQVICYGQCVMTKTTFPSGTNWYKVDLSSWLRIQNRNALIQKGSLPGYQGTAHHFNKYKWFMCIIMLIKYMVLWLLCVVINHVLIMLLMSVKLKHSTVFTFTILQAILTQTFRENAF